jgi:hypothetical protein
MEYKRCKPIIGRPEKWLDTRQNQNYNRSVLSYMRIVILILTP